MEGSIVVIFVGLLVLLSHGFVVISNKTRIPDVLFLICIGILLGPVFKMVESQDFGGVGHVFTMIVLVLILFEGGIELKLEDLRSSLREILVLTFVSYIISAIAIWLALTWLSEFAPVETIFLAAVLAGPAPSVVIPLIRHLKLGKYARATLTTESALGETLSILIALAALDWLRIKDVNYGRMVGMMLSSFVLAVGIGLVSGYLWSLILNRVRQLKNAMFMTPAVVFIIYGICEMIGYSGPVAALAFGITIGNISLLNLPPISKRVKLVPIHLNEPERLFLGEVVFLAKTFFFVYLGSSLELTSAASLKLALLLTVILLVARIISVRFSIRSHLMSSYDAGVLGSLIPKGLAAAVLATLFFQLGSENGEAVKDLLYGTIITSIVISSIVIAVLHKAWNLGILNWPFGGFENEEEENQ